MGLMDRIKGLVPGRSKSFGPGPIPSSWPVDWFQQGYYPASSQSSSVVESCVSAYAQTIAQMPGLHTRREKDGSRTVLSDTNIAAILNKPNDYQTLSDFLLNLVYSIQMQGNGYFVGNGTKPSDTTAIYLLDPRNTRPTVIRPSGDVFYSSSGQWAEMASDLTTVMIPSRYVGHVKLYTPNDPLVGVTPIASATTSVAANNSITQHQASFFQNMSRPSGVLTTEQELKKDQINMLREAWNNQAKNLNSGGVPILANGLNWQSLSMTSQDAELVAAWKMTVEDISRVFRVPPMLINNMENATFSNASALMEFWLSSGLGFMIRHIEQVLNGFFDLPPNEAVVLDTEALMRSDLAGRIAALGDAVTKGIYSPNEARAREMLPPVEGGEMPRVQQQMVPLDWEIPNNEAETDPIDPDAEPDEDEIDIDMEDQEAMALLSILVKSDLREISL